MIAVGTYVAQDLRDAEGLTRPMLRRAAIRLALSRREPARRLGSAYLRARPAGAGSAARRRLEVIDATRASSPRPAIDVGAGRKRAVRRRRTSRRFEVGRLPLYHEHMLITAEETDAAPTH